MARPVQRAKAHRWGKFAALLAVLALLFQTVAIPPTRAEAMELCTAHGTKTIFVAKQGPASFMDCEHCGHCVLTPPAADAQSPVLSAPVRYFQTAYVAADSVDTLTRGARAPPRPPGQGPPNL